MGGREELTNLDEVVVEALEEVEDVATAVFKKPR